MNMMDGSLGRRYRAITYILPMNGRVTDIVIASSCTW